MSIRTLFIARHGMADAFGDLTPEGADQMRLLGRRLGASGVQQVWHSPLPRAVASAAALAWPDVPTARADELVDHIPYVPPADQMPSGWRGFFDGFDEQEARTGERTAEAMLSRFFEPRAEDRTELLITHAYQVSWFLRAALAAPAAGWLSVATVPNAALTMIKISDQAPNVVLVNDMTHLPPELRWTGFGGVVAP
ncbi:MAG: histidine phosphatase family protein [Propionibacteriales bacterium]|nr:histidine phosphatase family protein [Propionibacteriales bacterium]